MSLSDSTLHSSWWIVHPALAIVLHTADYYSEISELRRKCCVDWPPWTPHTHPWPWTRGRSPSWIRWGSCLIRMSVWRTDCVCVLLHNSQIRDYRAFWQNATPRLQERPAHFSKKVHILVYSQGTNKSSLVILFFIGDGGIDHLKDLIGFHITNYVDLFFPSWSRRCNVRILVITLLMIVTLILYIVHVYIPRPVKILSW